MGESRKEIPVCMPSSAVVNQLNDLRYAMYSMMEELSASMPLDCARLEMDERTFANFIGFVIDAKEDVEELRKTIGYLTANVNAMKHVEPVTITEGKYGL